MLLLGSWKWFLCRAQVEKEEEMMRKNGESWLAIFCESLRVPDSNLPPDGKVNIEQLDLRGVYLGPWGIRGRYAHLDAFTVAPSLVTTIWGSMRMKRLLSYVLARVLRKS
mgnify:CR=1 FL=1